jgi:hypothetical protein
MSSCADVGVSDRMQDHHGEGEGIDLLNKESTRAILTPDP